MLRRYKFIFLFFAVLVLPFVVRRAVGPRSTAAPLPADGGGPPLELVIVTPHNQDIRRAYERAFADWHQARHGRAVRVTYLTPGGTNDIVRYLADLYGAQRDATTKALPPEERMRVTIDLVWGGGDVTFEREFKPFLKPVNLDPALLAAAFPTPDLNGVPLYEPTRPGGPAPKWVGVVLSSFGVVYNPTLCQTLGVAAPQTWADLADPRLAGFVALADPTRSGSAAVAYLMAVQRGMADAEESFFATRPEVQKAAPAERAKDAAYQAALAAGWKQGMRVLLLMAANARYFTDSAGQVPNDVGNGEAAAGVAIDFYARVYQDQIGPQRIRYVAPRGATAITPDPIAVLYGVTGEREQLANRFIEFLLSPDGQRLWNLEGGRSPYLARSLRRQPIRRDVYADRTGWADPDTNPFEESAGFNLRQEWMRLFSDTRAIWAAAWIDSRGALKDAHAAVLRVPDPDRRRQLLVELSDLPIEMSDVAALNDRRRALESGKDTSEDPRLWVTRQRITWAASFREHYEAVAAKARQQAP